MVLIPIGGEPHSFQTGSQDWEHTSTSDAFRLYREEVRVDGACSLWCLNGVVMVLEELSKQRAITVPDSIPCCELLPNCKSPFPYIGKTMNMLGLLVLTQRNTFIHRTHRNGVLVKTRVFSMYADGMSHGTVYQTRKDGALANTPTCFPMRNPTKPGSMLCIGCYAGAGLGCLRQWGSKDKGKWEEDGLRAEGRKLLRSIFSRRESLDKQFIPFKTTLVALSWRKPG